METLDVPTAPTGISLVICDSIYTDASTGKTALVGVFSNISAARFPATHRRCYAFASVTSVRKGNRLTLRIVNSESDEEVANVETPVPENVTPLTICDFSIGLNNLKFPAAGKYHVELMADGVILVQRPFYLVQSDS